MSLPDEQPLQTVSPSRLKVYRECPKLYDYTYRKNLHKAGPPLRHFDKGNYFHELCHVYYRLVKEGLKPGSDTAKAMMTQRIQEDLRTKFSMDKLDIISEVTTKFMRYLDYQSPRIDAGMNVLGVEEEFKVPVLLPSGRTILLHGFFDLRYSVGKKLFLRDHKTGQQAWDGEDVNLATQFLFYAMAMMVLTGEIYSVEVNFINTKELKTKVRTDEETFAYKGAHHSRKELENFLDDTLHLIDEMLDSRPTPHYDERVCKYCPFKDPCIMERKGISPDRILASHYVSIDRDKVRERSLSSNDTNNNSINPVS